MDANEARKVTWLNNYPRPLGELFDEGYLKRSRLAWAIENARDPKLREAAAVLLAELPAREQAEASKRSATEKAAAKSFDVGISLDAARRKPWPFPPHKSEPMGALVDSRQLNLKDLGYAAENAWDDSVRKSAMALMLERLDQIIKEPPPTSGLVEVHSSGRSYSKERETWYTFLQGGLFGILACVTVVLSIWLMRTLIEPPTPGMKLTDVLASPTQTIGLLIGLGIVAAATWLSLRLPDELDRRLQKQISTARRGQEGEDRVLEVILQALDGEWKVFRNLRVPGFKKSDVDLVLVGPPGVWALEVKNLEGEYRNVGDTWQYRHGKAWRASKVHASREARAHASHLAGFLKADGLNVFANPVVVWANPDAALAVDNPSVAVWTLERLPDELGNIWYSKQMPAATRERISDKLDQLCKSQTT